VRTGHDHSVNNELVELFISLQNATRPIHTNFCEAMIDDFAKPAWAENHEKFSADVAAGLARLARWLRRRAKAEDETPGVTPHRGKRCRPQPHTPTS
jgi:hypothetical protein